jgi:transcription elongation factor Elf1
VDSDYAFFRPTLFTGWEIKNLAASCKLSCPKRLAGVQTLLAWLSMPVTLTCPRCHHIGLVRLEQVIQGTEVTTSYFCGACTHEWAVSNKPLAKPIPEKPIRRVGRTRIFGPTSK